MMWLTNKKYYGTLKDGSLCLPYGVVDCNSLFWKYPLSCSLTWWALRILPLLPIFMFLSELEAIAKRAWRSFSVLEAKCPWNSWSMTRNIIIKIGYFWIAELLLCDTSYQWLACGWLTDQTPTLPCCGEIDIIYLKMQQSNMAEILCKIFLDI